MLPDSKNPPTPCTQYSVCGPIPYFVHGQFVFPKSAIVYWDAAMPSATMPKTTINENDEPAIWKDKVGLSSERRISPPAANAMTSKYLDQSQFCLSVSAPSDTRHDLGAFRTGVDIAQRSISRPQQ
jgi:hypothetical protein